MKVTTDFAPRLHHLAPVLLAAFGALALLLAALAVWLVVDAWGRKQEMPDLEARRAQLEARQRELPVREQAIAQAELAALRRRIAAVKGVAGERGWPTPALLAKLEELLPDQAALVSLHHKRRDREALIVADASNTEALTIFLVRLEKEPHFAEPLLTRQTQPDGQNRRAVQFEIRLRERP